MPHTLGLTRVFCTAVMAAAFAGAAFTAEANDDVSAAWQALGGIAVEPERPAGYDRAAWAHWLDMDGNCRDARHDVLAEESVLPVVTTRDGCRVTAGEWRDAYTADVYLHPGDLDVDHLVPLKEAHDSGGWRWDAARRAAYANDLSDPRTLIAVGAGVNRDKGAADPAEWLPFEQDYLCQYAASWTLVKARWSLSMDERERIVVGNILSDCMSGGTSAAASPRAPAVATIAAQASSGSCTIKGNVGQDGSRLYHVPGSPWYDRTRIDERAGERWFCSEQEATAAGWRKAGG